MVIEKTFEEISHLIEHLDVLIVTATEIETSAVLDRINPFPYFEKILRVSKGNYTYHLGIFGSYTCIHFQCGMGSGNLNGSMIAVSESLKIFTPKTVVMPGIAFGIDSTKQTVGQVLVSESLIPYDFKRVGKDGTIHRDTQPSANPTLVNRFRTENSKSLPYKVNLGALLTGESLIDNIESRNTLTKAFPHAIGGEMEGRGIYVAAQTAGLPWILVKAICDFADGNKHHNKDEFQKLAANNAVDYCHTVFSKEKVFDDLDISSLNNKASVPWSKNDPDSIEQALFDVYDPSCKAFYISRAIDGDFAAKLSTFSVWLWGQSGWGKTCIAMKHLTHSFDNQKQIHLGNYIGMSGGEIFEAFLKEITGYSTASTSDLSKTAFEQLSKLSAGKTLCVFVDEIPLSNEKDSTDFVQKAAAFINYCAREAPNNKIRFIFSSLFRPDPNIAETQKKVFERMTILPISKWEDADLKALLDKIMPAVGITIPKQDQEYLLNESKGNPRLIKISLKQFLAYEGKKPLREIVDQAKVLCAR